MEGNLNESSRHMHHGDPTLPDFHFTEERPKMLEKLVKSGMTKEQAEAEIARQEHEITNKQAMARFKKEGGKLN